MSVGQLPDNQAAKVMFASVARFFLTSSFVVKGNELARDAAGGWKAQIRSQRIAVPVIAICFEITGHDRRVGKRLHLWGGYPTLPRRPYAAGPNVAIERDADAKFGRRHTVRQKAARRAVN